MSKVTIWHNPRCSKSRAALLLITDKGIDPVVVKYLEQAPTIAELEKALTLLKIAPIDLIRTKEPLFKELNLTPTQDNTTLLKAMSSHPKLIERPIVFANGKAAIGRPPEDVLKIL